MAQNLSAKAIRERLNSKEEQLRIIKAEIELLKSMLAEATGEPDPTAPAAPKPRAPRSNVKALILELLERTGSAGLNAAVAVDLAASLGQTLQRESASSILSRLKADGTVSYDGDRYRLINHSSGWPPNVHPHPASKNMP